MKFCVISLFGAENEEGRSVYISTGICCRFGFVKYELIFTLRHHLPSFTNHFRKLLLTKNRIWGQLRGRRRWWFIDNYWHNSQLFLMSNPKGWDSCCRGGWGFQRQTDRYICRGEERDFLTIMTLFHFSRKPKLLSCNWWIRRRWISFIYNWYLSFFYTSKIFGQ